MALVVTAAGLVGLAVVGLWPRSAGPTGLAAADRAGAERLPAGEVWTIADPAVGASYSIRLPHEPLPGKPAATAQEGASLATAKITDGTFLLAVRMRSLLGFLEGELEPAVSFDAGTDARLASHVFDAAQEILVPIGATAPRGKRRIPSAPAARRCAQANDENGPAETHSTHP